MNIRITSNDEHFHGALDVNSSGGSRPAERPCPQCGYRTVRLILPLSYAMYDASPLAKKQDCVACTRCGFVYSDTPSTEDDFHRYYYENLYYTNFRFEILGERGRRELSRHQPTAELLARHIADKSRPVVDIGCNNGAQLIALKNVSFSDPRGLDMLEPSVDYIRRLGFTAQVGSATQLPPMSPKPAAYLFSHVMEHIINPAAVLERVWELLDDGGFVYIEVPDAARYPLHDVTKWYMYILYEHVNHFDLAHVSALAGACGFELVESGTKHIVHRGIDESNVMQCLFGLFRKTKKRDGILWSYDGALERSIREKASLINVNPEHILATVARERIPVYIWGVSQFMQLMLECSPLGICRIEGILDRDEFKQSQTIRGMHIVDPEILSTASSESIVILPDPWLAMSMKNELQKFEFKGRVFILGTGWTDYR